MTPDEIKAVRRALSCTAKELASALELDQKTVLDWEKGDLFPTKQYIDKMNALRDKGPSAIPRRSKGEDPMRALADPAVWQLVRKIVTHRKLREAALKLAEGYPDPTDPEK